MSSSAPASCATGSVSRPSRIAARATATASMRSDFPGSGVLSLAPATAVAPRLAADPGCGTLIAAKLIGEIAGIARFASDAKLARLSGAAPIPASSGRTDRHRLDPGGNRQLNCAFYRLALTKARHDPETQAFLKRKQAEGKTRREARRALKRHLVRRVWHLLQPPTPDQATDPSPSIS